MMANLMNMYKKGKTIPVKLSTNASRLIRYLYHAAIAISTKIKKQITIWAAQAWQYYYRYKNRAFALRIKYRVIVSVIVVCGLIGLSWIIFPVLNKVIESYFSVSNRFSGLQTLFVSLGGAMIGATAIAFSLIMFAMQVNVERMPHGLFRKFSSDFKLLGTFAVTFLLAISITCLSLMPDKSWATLAVLGAVWCLVFLVLFLMLAYRRALSLISPTKQLAILVADTKKNFEIWSKAARRTAPLLKNQSRKNEDNQERHTNHYTERNTYFLLNPNWTTEAKKGISHCIAFARRYAEQGDHEVSAVALHSILEINSAYINVKGKTFFSNNYLIYNALTTDGFINDTLEHLRQNVQVGISRGDEQQIEQTFKAMLGLCKIYLNIEYASEYETKSHAHLATVYLSGSVESVVPHNMPDVLMDGIRQMGASAQLILSKKEPDHIAPIAEKIAIISCAGAVNEKYRPVTLTGVEQLANLTFELLRCDSHDVRYAISDIRNDIKLIAKMYLNIPDTPLTRTHSTSLAPYYFGLVDFKLPLLVKAVIKADESDKNAKRIIGHIEQWADGLYQIEKNLMLLAIEKRSFLTSDIIHSIKKVTNILCALSNAPACDEHTRDELRRHALWLISVLSWIPDEKEVINFVENYQVTEILFEAANKAHYRGCHELALKIKELLFLWAFKAGKYQIGLAILERSCNGLACLNIILDQDDDDFIHAVEEKVAQKDSPGLEQRFRASESIKEAANAYHGGHPLLTIEHVMTQVDQARLRSLLLGIADKLVPEELVKEQQKEQSDY